MLFRIAGCLCLLVAAPAAQTTWTVDASGGSGAQFTAIQPAVDAASAGDIIAIRAGSYAGFATGKPLAIQGEAGVVVDQVGPGGVAVSVSGIGAGETLSIHGLTIVPPFAFLPAVDISDNAGRVLLQQSSIDHLQVRVSESEVWIAGCQLTGLDVTDSTVVLADSRSEAGLWPHAATVTDSSLHVSGCTLLGQDASVVGIPGAGIRSSNSTMTVTDDGSNVISGGFGGIFTTPAIDGTGSLLVDPAVVLGRFGSPATGPAITVTTRTVPSVRATGGVLGGTIDVDVWSPAQGFYELFLGLPATPTPFPAFGGDLALGTVILPVQAGTQGPSRRTLVRVPLPNNSVLIGVPLAWQALGGNAPAVYLSNPGFTVIRP